MLSLADQLLCFSLQERGAVNSDMCCAAAAAMPDVQAGCCRLHTALLRCSFAKGGAGLQLAVLFKAWAKFCGALLGFSWHCYIFVHERSE
jgi:hypothetical protein